MRRLREIKVIKEDVLMREGQLGEKRGLIRKGRTTEAGKRKRNKEKERKKET